MKKDIEMDTLLIDLLCVNQKLQEEIGYKYKNILDLDSGIDYEITYIEKHGIASRILKLLGVNVNNELNSKNSEELNKQERFKKILLKLINGSKNPYTTLEDIKYIIKECNINDKNEYNV
jgi:hypothetical protein